MVYENLAKVLFIEEDLILNKFKNTYLLFID